MPSPGYEDSAMVNGHEYRPVNIAFANNDVANGIFWALPPLGIEPDHSGPMWTDTLVKFIGERTGIGRKRLNYEMRYAWMDLVIIGTPAGALAAKKALLEELTDIARYSIWIPNDVAETKGCTLAPMGRTYQKTLGIGKIGYLLQCTFQQLSDEN